jgi:wobble nucleotide-excising tRNase
LKITSFYSFLEDEILESNSKLKESKKEINLFLDNLKQELNKKRKDIFSKCRILDVTVPDSIDLVIDEVNQLIDRHNEYSDNFKKQQDSARNRLRYHVISEILEDVKKYPYEKEWKGYVFEIKNLEQLKQDYENKDKTIKEEAERLNGKEGVEDSDTIEGIKAIINRLEKERKEQLRLTQNTEYLANTINQKLLAGGNKNLKLKVCKVENNVECYMIHDEKNGIRDITRVSTGEKNIIAFLYFIGRLQSINQKQKKIIVFDDPMTSNDDATQYLMITELQKVYRDNNKVFNKDNDFFVCMTHNVHFYLNVQPQGVFKDKKGRTKYDLNNFYIIRNRDFFKVKNENEDFKTSYEALWMELNDLYKNDYLNSVLNTMRRIVETFIKFNKIHQDKFYKNKNEHLKLFNVGSHAAIDELSADSIGKTKEELSQMFRDLFVDNGFKDHFDSYWRN